MFERFTAPARAVVRGAVEVAERAGADGITPEHLLLALLDAEGTTAASVLAHFGVAGESVAAAVSAALRRGGLSSADAAALGELGIDLDTVVAAVERVHGEGAFTGRKRRPRRFHTPFTQPAKKVVEGALREALDRGDRFIGDEHVLLALLHAPGVAADVLAAEGLTHQAVRAHLARAS